MGKLACEIANAGDITFEALYPDGEALGDMTKVITCGNGKVSVNLDTAATEEVTPFFHRKAR